MVFAVFVLDVVDDLAAPALAEVDVDIGHADPLRVQEALEIQAVLDGVHRRDVQAVGRDAPRRRAAPRPHRDALALGIGDKIRRDEEIIGKAHAVDHVQLVEELFFDIFLRRAVLALEALRGRAF